MSTHTDIAGSITRSGLPAFGLIDEQLIRVKELINEQLTVPVPAWGSRGAGSAAAAHSSASKAGAGDINRLLEYVGSRSGKMIRPGLVLLAGCCCGKITDEHIRIAAIVEMIHNATLLHDDVMDDGQSRRGQPTINSLWGNESAVLLGDFLLSRVFKICVQLEPQVAAVIASATIRICEGELRQVVQRRNWQLSESEYIDIITEKSAALFSSCCYLGGLLAQGTGAQVRSLAGFGLNAGIAFQITDDLLDIVGDESKTGKTLGRDADKNKLTLAVIHLLSAVDEKERNAVINSYLINPVRGTPLRLSRLGRAKTGGNPNSITRNNKHVLVDMLSRYGSLEYARNRAQEYVAAAVQALASLEESDAKSALIETARFMASRTI
jgi:octaprenyl-diphosphate synthase